MARENKLKQRLFAPSGPNEIAGEAVNVNLYIATSFLEVNLSRDR
jgi:hypothetical protein